VPNNTSRPDEHIHATDLCPTTPHLAQDRILPNNVDIVNELIAGIMRRMGEAPKGKVFGLADNPIRANANEKKALDDHAYQVWNGEGGGGGVMH
jgi:hypothetical protein